MMINEVVHIGITVKNMDRSLEFYKNVLGLSYKGEILMKGKETDKLFGKENCKLRVVYLNGSEHMMAPPVELLEFQGENPFSDDRDRAELSRVSISEICFKVDNIDKTYLRLKEKGVEFISKPQLFDFSSEGFGKSKAVYFRDPDGIILELIESRD